MGNGSKLKVEICLGTTCFILGASELQDLAQYLEPELLDRVDIVGRTCLGFCKDRKFDGAPFVRLDERVVIERATVTRVTEKIKAMLKEKDAE